MFILAIPIIDIIFSSSRRILKGVSPFKADAEHIHHKLLHAGFSQNKIVLILVSISLAFGALAAILMKTSLSKYGLYAFILLLIMAVLGIHAKQTYKTDNEE